MRVTSEASAIDAGSRTVISIAEHFQELMESARQLQQRSGASDRGYFTPVEDQELRHLLVSYWQSRNALIEVVASFHEDLTVSDELRPACVLVAYAGALVLVDAARFLRDQFDESPVVREKLNEAEPNFGIPAGTYDRVQASLTSPVHAWHLYHAAKYYESNREQLRTLAAGHGWQPLLELVDRLQIAIDVDLTQFATARLREQTRQITEGVQRNLFRRALYGLQKAVSRLVSDIYVWSGHKPGLPDHIQQSVLDTLQPGDVLMTRKEHALSNYFLPGFWPHAAFFIGSVEQLKAMQLAEQEQVRPKWDRLVACDSEQSGRVVEAMKDGVWIRSVASPLASDAIAVLRPQIDESDVPTAIGRGVFHDGKPYDFDFDFTRSDRLVCTEVVYRSLDGLGDVEFPLKQRAGRLTLAAEDLVNMALERRHFDAVAVYVPGHTDELIVGQDCYPVIRSVCGGS